MGAINIATSGSARLEGASDEQLDLNFLAASAFENYTGAIVGDWNDAPGRTVDEVKAALLAAAEECAS
jgi:hypothetical protein